MNFSLSVNSDTCKSNFFGTVVNSRDPCFGCPPKQCDRITSQMVPHSWLEPTLKPTTTPFDSSQSFLLTTVHPLVLPVASQVSQEASRFSARVKFIKHPFLISCPIFTKLQKLWENKFCVSYSRNWVFFPLLSFVWLLPSFTSQCVSKAKVFTRLYTLAAKGEKKLTPASLCLPTSFPSSSDHTHFASPPCQ